MGHSRQFSGEETPGPGGAWCLKSHHGPRQALSSLRRGAGLRVRDSCQSRVSGSQGPLGEVRAAGPRPRGPVSSAFALAPLSQCLTRAALGSLWPRSTALLMSSMPLGMRGPGFSHAGACVNWTPRSFQVHGPWAHLHFGGRTQVGSAMWAHAECWTGAGGWPGPSPGTHGRAAE